MKNSKSNYISYVLLTLPALGLYTFFFIVPASIGVFYSLTDWSGISKTFNFIGLQNYLTMFTDARFKNALTFTLLYALLLVVITLAISLSLALLLSRDMKGRGFFRSVFFFPAVLSLITVGLIFNQLFYIPIPQLGKMLGIEALSSNILGNEKLAGIGILITNLWQAVALPTVIFLAGLQSVPVSLYEAATIDGAGAFQKFRYITIPFLIPMLSVNLVMLIRNGLTVFDYIQAMTGGGPGTSTESIGFLIYRLGFTQYKFSYGAAQSIVLLLVIVAISLIQNRVLSKKEVGQV
ncbi:MAG: sugar ABC transporter permease [Oscillospiraceae bacterium]